MSFVVRNDLGRFLDKIKSSADMNKGIAQKALKKVVDKGVELAQNNYEMINVDIYYQIDGNTAKITAKKDGIAYIEYGTGLVGQSSGYPQEYLPKTGVPITNSWQYYYDSPYKINGGWYFGHTFTRGQVAGMQMYDTVKQLNEYIRKDLVKDLKEGV